MDQAVVMEIASKVGINVHEHCSPLITSYQCVRSDSPGLALMAEHVADFHRQNVPIDPNDITCLFDAIDEVQEISRQHPSEDMPYLAARTQEYYGSIISVVL